MALPGPETDWTALHRRGFRHLIRLHPGDGDPAPLTLDEILLEDLYGGREPRAPAAEAKR